MASPAYARVRELFNYDPATGLLRWKTITSNRVVFGSIAGHWTNRTERVLAVMVDGRRFPVARIIWLWMTGECPTMDMNPKNNKWGNLRLASHSQNHANTRVRPDSAVGLKGVRKKNGRFYARIAKDGVRYHLGSFGTAAAAHNAYATKARELHGEFARAA